MRRFRNTIFGLNEESSIWIEQEDLGKEKTITLKNKRYSVKIPKNINKNVVLRLRGLGRTKDNQTGDLLLHIWLNKGDDIRKSLWLSETSARNGAEKILLLDEEKIKIVIPPRSYDGLTIRLKGLGIKPNFSWRGPFLHRKSGNLLVRLFVYPDIITPNYGSFENLATDDMALEGWVYRKIDEVIKKIGESSFLVNPVQADAVADLFNERGWRGIFHALVGHLKLTHLNITLTKSDSISKPGTCQRTVTRQNNTPAVNNYVITINEQFLDNPFSIAAIMAHELCHVIYSESIDDGSRSAGYKFKSEQASLEEERTVDLLVFMFKIGEFQLRVARDERLTLGYFNQGLFERIQVIVSKKVGLH
jgi:hypothetical protein